MASPDHTFGIELNNRGALFIETGLFDEAIPVLSHALCLTKKAMRESAVTSPEPGKCCSLSRELAQNVPVMDCARSRDDTAIEAFIVSLGETAPCCPTESELSAKNGYFYKCPIRIQMNQAQRNSGFQSAVNTSAVVLFNLSIAHHLGGIQDGRLFSVKKLQKAMIMYELCHQLFVQGHVQTDALVVMVLLNNLGQIHAMLGSREKGCRYFERLLSLMMYVLMDGGKQYQGHEQVFEGFFQNVSSLLLSTDSAAAA